MTMLSLNKKTNKQNKRKHVIQFKEGRTKKKRRKDIFKQETK